MPHTDVAHFEKDRHHDAVIALWTKVFGYETAHNEPSLAIQKKLDVDDGLFFIAEDESGAIVGTVMGGYDGHRGWIYSLAVAPGEQKSGIGSALMNRVEKALADLGCVKINLQIVEGNDGVAKFYAKLGYAIEPRISMGKRLG